MDINTASAKNSLEEQHIKSIERLASNQSLNAPKVNKEKKLQEACEGFEAVFIQKMWEGMRASLPKEGLLHSKDEQFWQGMYDQELGKSLAKAGGIGLADMMMTQLSRNLHSASEVAATTQSRTPMNIAPAPLVPPKSPEDLAAEAKSVNEQIADAKNAKTKLAANNPEDKALPNAKLSADIYSGEAVQPDAPSELAGDEAALKNPLTAANGNGSNGNSTGINPANATNMAGANGIASTQAVNGPPVVNPTPPEVLAHLNEFATQLGLPLPNTGVAQVPASTEVSPIIMQALQEAQANGQQVTHMTTYTQKLQPKRTNREPSRFANRVDANHPVVTGRQRQAAHSQAMQSPQAAQANQAMQSPQAVQASQAMQSPQALQANPNIASPVSPQAVNNPSSPTVASPISPQAATRPTFITPTVANPMSPQAVNNPTSPISPQAVTTTMVNPLLPQAGAPTQAQVSSVQTASGIELARNPVQAINTGFSKSNPEISS